MKTVLSGMGAGVGVLALSLFIAGGALGFGRLIAAQGAFLVSTLGMVLGVAASVAGLVMLARSGFEAKTAMALLGAIPALFLVYSVVSSLGAPLINDISTDLVYPPQFSHARTLPANQGRNMSYPESFKTQMEKGYPRIQSLGVSRTRDAVFTQALEIARAKPGWTITSTTVAEKESSLEGTATSRVFGFVDDFVLRITDMDAGVVVDMRSKSRDGKGDFGVNAERIRSFLTQLQS